MIPEPALISGAVLCGGRGQRMGGQDKGLLSYRGEPLVAHAVRALSGVADTVLINANRNLPGYRAFGLPVWPDEPGVGAGPLAGLLTVLRQVRTPWVLTLPCDTPHFDATCLLRLCAAWQPGQTDICTVTDGHRLHPVIALVDSHLTHSLAACLAGGERKVETWFRHHRLSLVDYSDCPEVLINLNTPDDWTACNRSLT